VASLPRANTLFMEPLKRETVMDTVARRIESLMRTGELRVGSLLPPEPKLAAMLGVSRSSLREALKGLVFLGLIKARPGYGTYIQSTLGRVVSRHFQWMLLLQEIKYLELYELRQILEPAVAALAARRASKDDTDKMEAAIGEMKKHFHQPEQYMAAEMAFHEGFLQAAKNVATQTMLRMMYDALAEGRRRVLPLISDIEQNYRRHERIFNCILKRDAKGARNAVLNDLRYAEALLRKDLLTQERLRARMAKPELSKRSNSKRSVAKHH
jgi:DNA-binding FadR family transcriptional regulator